MLHQPLLATPGKASSPQTPRSVTPSEAASPLDFAASSGWKQWQCHSPVRPDQTPREHRWARSCSPEPEATTSIIWRPVSAPTSVPARRRSSVKQKAIAPLWTACTSLAARNRILPAAQLAAKEVAKPPTLAYSNGRSRMSASSRGVVFTRAVTLRSGQRNSSRSPLSRDETDELEELLQMKRPSQRLWTYVDMELPMYCHASPRFAHRGVPDRTPRGAAPVAMEKMLAALHPRAPSTQFGAPDTEPRMMMKTNPRFAAQAALPLKGRLDPRSGRCPDGPPEPKPPIPRHTGLESPRSKRRPGASLAVH